MNKMQKEVLEFKSREEFERAYLYDLPRGGVFVNTSKEYSIGELVVLVILLPEIPDGILLHGRVAWRRPPTKWSSALQPGIGVSLDEAEPEKVEFLRNFFLGRSEDRRGRSRRIPVDFRVDFGTTDKWYEGKAINISKEGIFISTDASVLTGEILILKLYLNETNQPDHCYGRVARRCRDSNIPGLGVELEYKTPIRRRKIYNYIQEEEARLIEIL